MRSSSGFMRAYGLASCPFNAPLRSKFIPAKVTKFFLSHAAFGGNKLWPDLN